MRRIRSRLTYANVMVTILAFIVLGGGTALASFVVSSNSQIGPGTVSGHRPPSGDHANVIAGSVNGQDVGDNSLGGADINESALGKVPNAAQANNATNLGGKPASDYRLHCPGALDRAADLCYEVGTRPEATYNEALKACALDQRRLPDAGELALVYDHLSAAQDYEWTVGWFTDSGAVLATVLGQNSSRVVIPTANTANSTTPFRCVTSATN